MSKRSQNYASYFKKIKLFCDLDEAGLEKVAVNCLVWRLDADETVIEENDSTSDIFFLLKGSALAKAYSQNGREVTFIELAEGDMFGEFSAIDDLERSASVMTKQESLVARMTGNNFRHLLENDVTLANKMIALLVAKARAMSERIFEFTALGVKNRLHAELCRLAKKNGIIDNRAVLAPAPTHYDLATRISTHREAITRELRQLCDKGIVDSSRTKIIIHDVAALQQMVLDNV